MLEETQENLGGRNRGKGGRSSNSKPTCQVCGKIGHVVDVCYGRYGNKYMGSTPKDIKNTSQTPYSTYIIATETVPVQSWLLDSGAVVMLLIIFLIYNKSQNTMVRVN